MYREKPRCGRLSYDGGPSELSLNAPKHALSFRPSRLHSDQITSALPWGIWLSLCIVSLLVVQVYNSSSVSDFMVEIKYGLGIPYKKIPHENVPKFLQVGKR